MILGSLLIVATPYASATRFYHTRDTNTCKHVLCHKWLTHGCCRSILLCEWQCILERQILYIPPPAASYTSSCCTDDPEEEPILYPSSANLFAPAADHAQNNLHALADKYNSQNNQGHEVIWWCVFLMTSYIRVGIQTAYSFVHVDNFVYWEFGEMFVVRMQRVSQGGEDQ